MSTYANKRRWELRTSRHASGGRMAFATQFLCWRCPGQLRGCSYAFTTANANAYATCTDQHLRESLLCR